ncbi:CotO family spore coat protein [Bacillus sp. FJAT-47783]|uniref:CotO family spore coat protein n=1 Tax=Bacillus sp. FJAT-47783 TaxID=2922712 RepID=UPI001FAC52FC|nr:CotO family spore coat protein [Bacillus sp. FJAT-47783]
MKKHQSFQNPPLMYIIQPDLEPVFSSMQKAYVVKKRPIKAKEPEQKKKKEKAEREKEKKPITSFNMLTNEQKIQTLLNLPESLKHVSCHIRTKSDETYTGKVEDYQEGYVTINSSKVKFEEIDSITLIGL